MCSRLFRVVVECEASGASRMQVDAYAAGAPGGGPVEVRNIQGGEYGLLRIDHGWIIVNAF